MDGKYNDGARKALNYVLYGCSGLEIVQDSRNNPELEEVYHKPVSFSPDDPLTRFSSWFCFKVTCHGHGTTGLLRPFYKHFVHVLGLLHSHEYRLCDKASMIKHALRS